MMGEFMPARFGEPLTIVADSREAGSGIPAALREKGVVVKILPLQIADYILSPNLAIERKTTADFMQSIIDKRLFTQVDAMRRNFNTPVLILEKCQKPLRAVQSNALRGALVYTSVKNRIPILYTKNKNDTVEMLHYLAKMENEAPAKTQFSYYPKRKPTRHKPAQRYMLEAIPGVGPGLADLLLKKFGSLHAVLNASKDDLAEITGIGKQRAEKIFDLFQQKYEV
ncbi:MAG: ERCC4 domain-containing protein [bacterium]